MLDGKITDDSKPLSKEEMGQEQLLQKNDSDENQQKKRSSMSFGTSFGLSLSEESDY